MKKQILSLVFLSFLGLLQSYAAAPANASGSTEDADRQFLENLEKTDAAKMATPAAAPAGPATADKSHLTDKTAQGRISTRRLADTLDFDDSAQISESDEVADSGAIPENSSTNVRHVTGSHPVKSHRTARHSGEHRFLHHLLERVLSHHPEDW